MANDKVVSLDDQINSVVRELSLRRRVYPRWVENRRMSQNAADHEIAAMEAVLSTLRAYQDMQIGKKVGIMGRVEGEAR